MVGLLYIACVFKNALLFLSHSDERKTTEDWMGIFDMSDPNMPKINFTHISLDGNQPLVMSDARKDRVK